MCPSAGLTLNVVVACLTTIGILCSESASELKAQDKELILPGETFHVGDNVGFIFWPPESQRRSPQPWVFYAPTLPPYPDSHEKWMHEQFLNAGVAVAGLDVGEAYGSPNANQRFDEFYKFVTTQKGLSPKPCLLGRSRGGLWVTSWACDHPDQFSGIAGIYPVFDFSTYPGLENAAPAYGLSPDELKSRANELNPIKRMQVLAKHKLPVFIIHGDSDTVVPLKENSQTFADTYQREGAADAIQLMVVEGQGHNYWEGFFRCEPLIKFVITHAQEGATTKP